MRGFFFSSLGDPRNMASNELTELFVPDAVMDNIFAVVAENLNSLPYYTKQHRRTLMVPLVPIQLKKSR